MKENTLATAEKEITAAWQSYHRVEKYGLEFGATVYKWREEFKAKGFRGDAKGKGILPILEQCGIPTSTAYWWINRYEVSLGLRAAPTPRELEDDDEADPVDFSDEDPEKMPEGQRGRYWLTPPDLYASLNKEFGFDFDPCPYPLPPGFDGLKTEWGKVNFVNPPFCKADCMGDGGLTAWCMKLVEEQAKGKTSFITLPAHSYLSVLAQAGAEMRDLGRIRWLEVKSKQPTPGSPQTIIGFVLRGKKSAKAARTVRSTGQTDEK
jgi:hypothetical protein